MNRKLVDKNLQNERTQLDITHKQHIQMKINIDYSQELYLSDKMCMAETAQNDHGYFY